MKNIKKYAIVAAIVLPSVFTFGKTSEASKAKLNTEKATSVNVRSEANLGNNILGQINDSEKYEIKDTVSNKGGNWLKIEFEGKEAYVGSPWFDIIEETEVISPSNFREKDNTDSKIFKVLDKGDKVEIIEPAKNNYFKVRFEGKEGYLYAPNLDLKDIEVAQQSQTQVVANDYYSGSTQSYSDNYYSQSAPSYNYDNSYVGSNSSAKEIIAQRESGGSYDARNGQYIGRYQLSASYLNGDYSAENQERVADNYVSQRYGSWENALNFWNNNGWY